jgi:uracil-DNA glycosylase family 4
MPVTGDGEKKILVVAEAPGKEEDKRGIQLIGDAGKTLRRIMSRIGLDLDEDCWKTNAVICRPPHNETPDINKIEACRPNLLKTIKELKPRVVILLGNVAVKSLIGYAWKEDTGPLNYWVGWRIPYQRFKTWICPSYHPSFILRGKDDVAELFLERHLRKAVSCAKSPPPVYPDPKEAIEIIMEPKKAARIIDKMQRTQGGYAAFDYEANTLKPENPKSKIVSCSICWNGKRTIAYPWHGEAIEATGDFLKSPKFGKIASNLKFEERWTRAKFGHPVKNWAWDTMIAAHVMDNRKGITGLKFQSFVNFGFESYDDHIKPLLAAPAHKLNRIDEINLKDLLLYNGLDSLLEYRLFRKQTKGLT